jgi:hypothetical protein
LVCAGFAGGVIRRQVLVIFEVCLGSFEVGLPRGHVGAGVVNVGLDGVQVQPVPGQLGGGARLLGVHVRLPGLRTSQVRGPDEGVVVLPGKGQFEVRHGQGGLSLLTVPQADKHVARADAVAALDEHLIHPATHEEGQVEGLGRDGVSLGDDDGRRGGRAGCGGFVRFGAAGGQQQGQGQKDESRDLFHWILLDLLFSPPRAQRPRRCQ